MSSKKVTITNSKVDNKRSEPPKDKKLELSSSDDEEEIPTKRAITRENKKVKVLLTNLKKSKEKASIKKEEKINIDIPKESIKLIPLPPISIIPSIAPIIQSHSKDENNAKEDNIKNQILVKPLNEIKELVKEEKSINTNNTSDSNLLI